MDDSTRRFLQRQARALREARDSERGMRPVNDLLRAQPCAVQIKDRCRGEATTELWMEDPEVTVCIPACGCCATIARQMMERTGQRQELEYRLYVATVHALCRLIDTQYLIARRGDFGKLKPRLCNRP